MKNTVKHASRLATFVLATGLAATSFSQSAHATGDVWLEGSYEFLNLPNVQFINNYFVDGGGNGTARENFVNDDGDFDGFRFDGGIANIPIMGGAYVMNVKGFYAWHDDKSDLQCGTGLAFPFSSCFAVPLFDPSPATLNYTGGSACAVDLFTTERDIDHFGVSVDVARGPMGLRAGPALASAMPTPSQRVPVSRFRWDRANSR